MIALGIKLFLAHILGDFVFQPDSWVTHKMQQAEVGCVCISLCILYVCLFCLDLIYLIGWA